METRLVERNAGLFQVLACGGMGNPCPEPISSILAPPKGFIGAEDADLRTTGHGLGQENPWLLTNRCQEAVTSNWKGACDPEETQPQGHLFCACVRQTLCFEVDRVTEAGGHPVTTADGRGAKERKIFWTVLS